MSAIFHLAIVLCSSITVLAQPAGAAFRWDLPDWIPPPAEPAANRITPAKVELGRHLFYDRRLSADLTMACATCHVQSRAFTDGKRTPGGVTGGIAERNTMRLGNVGYFPTLSWGNPRCGTAEVKAMISMFVHYPVVMGLSGKETLLLSRLRGESRYRVLFAEAFPDKARVQPVDLYSLSTITQALASFQRTLLTF